MLLNSTTIPPLSKLGYLPVIDASPTRMDTVYTILMQCVAIADSLEFDSLVLVMDQAIYSKAQQIRWQKLFIQGAICYSLRGLPHSHGISRYNREALSRLWS